MSIHVPNTYESLETQPQERIDRLHLYLLFFYYELITLMDDKKGMALLYPYVIGYRIYWLYLTDYLYSEP